MPRTLAVDYRPLDQIRPARRNPKRHDLAAIRASIRRFGLGDVAGIVDDRTGRLVAGHGRIETLADMAATGDRPPPGVHVDDGVWLIPVLIGARFKNRSEAEAFLLGHNRTGELGGWDRDELALVLTDHHLDLDGTGYTLGDIAPAEITDDPDPEPTPDGDPLTVPGDVWHIGPHTLVCGDCRDPQVVADLVGTRTVNLAVTSPPYADRRAYDDTPGFRPIPPDDYVAWFAPVAANVAAVLADDGSWCVNIKPGSDGVDRELYVLDLVAAHVREWGWHFAEEFCWERVGVPREPRHRLKNGFEPVYQFTRGAWKWRPDHVTDKAIIPIGEGAGDTNWAPLQGKGGDLFARNKAAAGPRSFAAERVQGIQSRGWFEGRQFEGWAYPSNRLPPFTGGHEATGHPAAYPPGLPEFLTRLLTDPGDVILDPFTGSGSTIIAAHRASRVGLGIELSPGYVDVALARIQYHTGIEPTRDGQARDLLAHTGWISARAKGNGK